MPSTSTPPCDHAAPVSASLSVADLKPRRAATIIALTGAGAAGNSAGMAQRLAELGFIAGETVSVLHRGPGGREPIAVQVGDTVFALRRHEASCIRVSLDGRMNQQTAPQVDAAVRIPKAAP